MRAVISGATGAIGMALVELLESKKIETLVLCHTLSRRCAQIFESEYIKKLECSLEDMKDIEFSGYGKYDVFFHLAWSGTVGEARNDTYLQNLNVKYTLDALKLAKKLGCHTFIGAGSQAEYGRFEGILTPDTPTFPESAYGIAKLCAGQMSRILASSLGIRHIWTRILSVYGPYDTNTSMVMSAIKKLLCGEVPQFTKGEQIWDYMYSKDAAAAFLTLAENGRDGEIYCIGSGEACELREYIKKIRDSIDEKLELGIGVLPYAEKQVMYLASDISKLRTHTGFAPKYSFDEGIRETVLWARNNI